MAEVIIARGFISSVTSCIDMGSKISERLECYLSRRSPLLFYVTLRDTIHLLISTFEQLKSACENGVLDFDSQKRLMESVEGCRRLLNALEDYLQECLPAEGDSFEQKVTKYFKIIPFMKAIGDIQRNLEAYVQIGGFL